MFSQDMHKKIGIALSHNPQASILCVMLSGFSGAMNMPLFLSARNFFNKQSMDVLRIHFCHEPADATVYDNEFDLEDYSLEKYATELNAVIQNKATTYKKIIFIGHSFGAVVCIKYFSMYHPTTSFYFIMWDPSELPWSSDLLHHMYTYDEKTQLYQDVEDGQKIKPVFYQELQTFDSVLEFSKLDINACIILPQNNDTESISRYLTEYNVLKRLELHTIANTDHLFSNSEARDELFGITLNYILSRSGI